MVQATPEDADRGAVTLALERLRRGDGSAADELFPLVYAELKRLAGSAMRGQRHGHTLQPTALVHEAFLRLAGSGSGHTPADRQHFFALAARAMRQVLVDHARRKRADKRGGDMPPVSLDGDLGAAGAVAPVAVDVLDVDRALDDLASLHQRQARVVELRFFAGMTIEETAHALEVSTDTIKSDTAIARRWLQQRLPRS